MTLYCYIMLMSDNMKTKITQWDDDFILCLKNAINIMENRRQHNE